MAKVIFIFLDGVGLASRSMSNPLWGYPMTRLKSVLGTQLLLPLEPPRLDNALLMAIDASLGVSGEGQSGTGQFSIYTGLNGPQRFGRHFGPHVPSTLRAELYQNNPFKRLHDLGYSAVYANAYPTAFIEGCKALRNAGKVRTSVLCDAAIDAGIPLLDAEAVLAHRAVSGDITSAWWATHPEHGDARIAAVAPEAAAHILLSLSTPNSVVFYECFMPDLYGHGRSKLSAEEIVFRLDGFLAGVIAGANPDETLLILTSDHGNFEDSERHTHTENPVPLLVYGYGCDAFKHAKTLTDIFPTLLSLLHEA